MTAYWSMRLALVHQMLSSDTQTTMRAVKQRSTTLPLQITSTERATFSQYLSSQASLSPYNLTLALSSDLSNSTLDAAVALVALTSSAAYVASSKGWSARAKRKEMLEKGMRFMILRPPRSTAILPTANIAAPAVEDAITLETGAKQDEIAAFLSYFPVHEIDPDALPPQPRTFTALYIYELHVHPAYRGHQLGTCLMNLAHDLAAALKMNKTMLTVFYSNVGARRLYERLGYVFWDEEYVEVVRRRLRGGVKEEVRKPGYVILARDVEVVDEVGGARLDDGEDGET